MSDQKIEFKNVSYSYPDGNRAVKEISFMINHGESVGIVGANGAGKSSILMLLTGILLPGEGEIRVGDTPVTRKTLPVIRSKIGFTFQDPDDQLFMTSVYDDVAFGPRNYGLDEAEVKKRVTTALATVGALHLKDRAPYKLSGGEKRAAAIATVLSMEPDVLVMDEPTAALDPGARRRLINLLAGFTHTKIIASHDLDMVLEICERTIILNEGQLICDGPSAGILSDRELLTQCGLEEPLGLKNCPLCSSKKNNRDWQTAETLL